jgi:hypothetical protein
LVLNVTGRAGGFGAGEMKRVKGGRGLCTLHGFLSHSGFRSVSDPTSQPHVTAVDRSAARYTCYASRSGPGSGSLITCPLSLEARARDANVTVT